MALKNDVLRRKLAKALEIEFVPEQIDAEAEVKRLVAEFEKQQREEVQSSC